MKKYSNWIKLNPIYHQVLHLNYMPWTTEHYNFLLYLQYMFKHIGLFVNLTSLFGYRHRSKTILQNRSATSVRVHVLSPNYVPIIFTNTAIFWFSSLKKNWLKMFWQLKGSFYRILFWKLEIELCLPVFLNKFYFSEYNIEFPVISPEFLFCAFPLNNTDNYHHST